MTKIVVIQENNTGSFQYQAHAENCADIKKHTANKKWSVFYTGNSYIEFSQEFADLASDYLSDDDTKEMWDKATTNEASHVTSIKPCCEAQVNAELLPLKDIEVKF